MNRAGKKSPSPPTLLDLGHSDDKLRRDCDGGMQLHVRSTMRVE